MKALSIRSPWWEKIVSGEKTIETRTWTTRYRGALLICASQPKGAAVAIAVLADCRPMMKEDEAKACCPIYKDAQAWILESVIPIKPFPVKGQLSVFDVKVSSIMETLAAGMTAGVFDRLAAGGIITGPVFAELKEKGPAM